MKKLIGFIIAGIIVAGLGVGIFFMIKNYNDNKEFSVSVETSVGGCVDVTFDDTADRVINGVASSYTIKNNNKVVFTSVANNNYIFTGWTVDGIACGTNATLSLNITDDTYVKANFEEKVVTLTINDSADQTFSETVELSLNKNLLTYLNSKYSAPRGYAYSYSCNGQPVTSSTTLTNASTITRTKNMIEYTITYKLPDGYTFDGTNNTKEVVYTIENVSTVTAPSLPTANKHFTLAWNGTINNTNFDTVSVIRAAETAITYPVTFTLAEGTFDGTNSSVVKNLTALDMSYPTLPTPEKHYEYSWNTTITADNLDTITTVTATKNPIEYTVTYKLPDGYTFDGTNNTKEVVYTIENVNSIIVPAFPSVTHYTLAWDNTITSENLGTINTITAVPTAKIYTVTFKHNGEEIKSINYSADNATINVSDIPSVPSATENEFYIWEDYSEKLATKGNFDINSQAVAKINIQTKYENNINSSGLNAIYYVIGYIDNTYDGLNNGTVYHYAAEINKLGTIAEFAAKLNDACKDGVALIKVNNTTITAATPNTLVELLTNALISANANSTEKKITITYGAAL